MSQHHCQCASSRNPLASKRGFTLIELLVVVAIIALLISILLPSLGQARAQSRSALCATRISQLAKCILIYADDFNETPPFTGIGWENISNPPESKITAPTSTTGAPGDISTKTRYDWAVSETWHTQHPELLWSGLLPEEDWAVNGVGIRTGTLFNYARFETLYRCPDFEREPDLVHHQFNYTRSILGRKWIMSQWAQGGKEPDYWGTSLFGASGSIMRISQIYAPSGLQMMIDEWGPRFVASQPDMHRPPYSSGPSGGWSACDAMHFFLRDEIGRYHGSPRKNPYGPNVIAKLFDTGTIKMGNASFYDGHVEMFRDVWADKYLSDDGKLIIAAQELFTWLSGYTYAQRGKVIVGQTVTATP